MATRSHIAIKKDSKYEYIYNHHDSYLEHLGVMLFKHYNSEERAKELVALGDTTSIYPFIENTAGSYEEHMAMPYEMRGTVADYRESIRWKEWEDKKWDDCKPRVTEDIMEVLGQAFNYIYDTEEGKWYVAEHYDNYMLIELDEILHVLDEDGKKWYKDARYRLLDLEELLNHKNLLK